MSGKVLTIGVTGKGLERPTSFPTVAAAELASFLPGETCSVFETRRFYQFDAASSETRDGIRVLTPAGGGRLLAVKTGSDDVEIPKIGVPDHQSLTQSLQVGLSAGSCNGDLVTDAGSETINIASGEGMIRATNSSDSEIFAFRWAAVNGVAIPLNSVRYVGVEYNSGSPQAVVRTSNNWNGQTEFQAATVVNEGGYLHIINNPQESCDGIQKIFHRLIETQPFQFAERIGGGRFSEVGTRNLSLSPCEFYDGLNEFAITIKNTSTGDTFDSYYGSFTKVASQTQWDNQNYDNAGTLTALSANRYGVHWLYIEMDDSFALVYGKGNYNTISDAEAALPPTSLPLRLSLGSRLAAKLIFQKGASSVIRIESAFDINFKSGMPVSHSDLSNILGNGTYHLSESERDAAIRIATASQSGLMSAAQVNELLSSLKTRPYDAALTYPPDFSGGYVSDSLVAQIISSGNFGNPGLFLRRSNQATGLDIWNQGSSGNSYIDNRWNAPSHGIILRVKSASGVGTQVAKFTSERIELLGGRIEGIAIYSTDTTITSGTAYTAVFNAAAEGVVVTLILDPTVGHIVRIINVSAYSLTVARNGKKINLQDANYTLSAGSSIILQFSGDSLGWLIIAKG